VLGFLLALEIRTRAKTTITSNVSPSNADPPAANSPTRPARFASACSSSSTASTISVTDLSSGF